MVIRRATLVLLVALLASACDTIREERVAITPAHTAADAPVLEAPSPANARDLDLHFHWREAVTRQVLPPRDLPSAFRMNPEIVAFEGEAHRALLLLPSLGGVPSTAAFHVHVPESADCELVAWTALEPKAQDPSDGVDFGTAVGEGDPDTLPLRFERLGAGKTTAWREVRVDLAPYRGRTVWIVLASRERRDRRGDRLLWADPRVRLKPSAAEPALIDLRTSSGAVPPVAPWSEVNVYKAYYLFKDEDAASTFPKSIPPALPWARSLRFFSSLGANWGPTLAREYEQQMGKNPSKDSTLERRWAEEYEYFHDGAQWRASPLAARFDWGPFDRMLDRAAATGLGIHLHLAGAPELFTGGRGWYPSYHYNELPIVDEAGWKDYVRTVFAHLASRPWFPHAHFSFFSEPNCMWVEYDGAARHFGFQGDAEQYARQYLWTWQAMRPYILPGQVHLGPWVVEPDPASPVEDNLPVFLRALRAAFERAGEPLPPWSAFAFNVYETPRLTLDNLPEYKIAYVRRLLARELPGNDLPLRFDEIGIHPLVGMAFEHDTGTSLASTRWSLAWHAEMLALVVDEEIQEAGPWYVAPNMPAYLAYVAATHVVRARDLETSAARTLVLRARSDAGRARAAVAVRVGANDARRVGFLASIDGDHGDVRLMAWQFPRFAVTDERLARTAAPERVTLQLPAAPHGWRLTIMTPPGVSPPFEGASNRERFHIENGGGVAAFDRVEITTDQDAMTLNLDAAGLLLIDAAPLP